MGDQPTVREDLLTAAGMAVGMLLAFGVSIAFFGSMRCWRQWLDILPESLLQNQQPMSRGNIGLSRLVVEWGGVDISTYLLAVLAIAFLVVAMLARRRKAKAETEPNATGKDDRALREAFLGICGGMAIMLLSARLVWRHYFVLVSPMLISACRPVGNANEQPNWRSFVYPAVGLLSLLVLSDLSRLIPYSRPLFDVATFVLFVLVLRDIYDGREPVVSLGPK